MLRTLHSINAAPRLPVVASGPTYWLNQQFNGGSLPGDWTAPEGTPVFGYTPALEGAASVQLGPWEAIQFDSGSDHTAFTLHCLWRTANVIIGDPVISFRSAANAELARLARDSAGVLRIFHGTIFANGGAYAVDTTYHLWIRYVAESGGGGNGTMQLYISESGTRPGSPSASITTGDGDAIRQIRLAAWNTGTESHVFDDVRAADADFAI